jgi:hypothetical protein
MKNRLITLPLIALLAACAPQEQAESSTSPEPDSSPQSPKHVVLLTGDEEYRSEEGLPMLSRILTNHHGFKTSVLYSINEAGEIDPTAGGSLTNPEALDSADLILMLLRFRHWDDATTQKFEAAVNRGVPIIALRTSTHPFNYPKESPYYSWTWNHPDGGWGEKVVGETWVSHWGKHKKEATRGVIEEGAKDHPILRGVSNVFGDSDVYEAHPPADAKILMRGQVLTGMTPDSEPASYSKKTKQGDEQPVNDPMMPVLWTRDVKNDGGTTNKVVCTTLGAATDLANEGLRRLVVNSVFWTLDMEVPKKANVDFLGEYNPTFYGFGEFKTGIKPSDIKTD